MTKLGNQGQHLTILSHEHKNHTPAQVHNLKHSLYVVKLFVTRSSTSLPLVKRYTHMTLHNFQCIFWPLFSSNTFQNPSNSSDFVINFNNLHIFILSYIAVLFFRSLMSYVEMYWCGHHCYITTPGDNLKYETNYYD